MSRVLLSVLLLTAVSCSQKPPEKPSVKTEAVPAIFTPDPVTASTVHGKVTYTGKVPPKKKISMEAEEACQKLHPTPVYDEPIVVSKAHELSHAFVYIKSGLAGKTFAPPTTAVVLDQHGCQFVPRVLALRKGQTLDVKNSDPVSHNIHPQPENNREWNQQQSPGTPDLQRRFGFPEVMIPVKCNVHAWMKSYIGVLDHPYFAVTGADGSFHFADLPPGEYVVAVWHEQLGELTHPLSVAAKSEAQVDFAYQQK